MPRQSKSGVNFRCTCGGSMAVFRTEISASRRWVRRFRRCRKCATEIETRETVVGPRQRYERKNKSTVEQLAKIAECDQAI